MKCAIFIVLFFIVGITQAQPYLGISMGYGIYMPALSFGYEFSKFSIDCDFDWWFTRLKTQSNGINKWKTDWSILPTLGLRYFVYKKEFSAYILADCGTQIPYDDSLGLHLSSTIGCGLERKIANNIAIIGQYSLGLSFDGMSMWSIFQRPVIKAIFFF